MKFGINQIWKQSPLFISRLKRAINFFTFGVTAFTPFICRVWGIDEMDFVQGIGLFGLGINSIGIMFGVEPEKKEDEIDE